MDSSGITITDTNQNTITLDSSGITLTEQSQASQIELTSSSVSVNSGALEVT